MDVTDSTGRFRNATVQGSFYGPSDFSAGRIAINLTGSVVVNRPNRYYRRA